eukprot:TRINITY_DN1155_c0_g1_i2.p1 TRINITY_DN1155_c0_g1~~TRINITY_DN1155_c0_g1_i2.p1  ORF type:complete len:365 (+),score=98.03 TRINITY_DN1155_c0_g1_i2:69-1097(+)
MKWESRRAQQAKEGAAARDAKCSYLCYLPNMALDVWVDESRFSSVHEKARQQVPIFLSGLMEMKQTGALDEEGALIRLVDIEEAGKKALKDIHVEVHEGYFCVVLVDKSDETLQQQLLDLDGVAGFVNQGKFCLEVFELKEYAADNRGSDRRVEEVYLKLDGARRQGYHKHEEGWVKRVKIGIFNESCDKVLMLQLKKSYDDKQTVMHTYTLPGGRVAGDEHPLDSLQREIKEELVSYFLVETLKPTMFAYDPKTHTLFYVARAHKADLRAATQDEDSTRFAVLDQWRKYHSDPDMKPPRTVVGTTWAHFDDHVLKGGTQDAWESAAHRCPLCHITVVHSEE